MLLFYGTLIHVLVLPLYIHVQGCRWSAFHFHYDFVICREKLLYLQHLLLVCNVLLHSPSVHVAPCQCVHALLVWRGNVLTSWC